MHHLHAVVMRGDSILIGDSGDVQEEGFGSQADEQSVSTLGNTNCLEACVERTFSWKKWLNGAAKRKPPDPLSGGWGLGTRLEQMQHGLLTTAHAQF